MQWKVKGLDYKCNRLVEIIITIIEKWGFYNLEVFPL